MNNIKTNLSDVEKDKLEELSNITKEYFTQSFPSYVKIAEIISILKISNENVLYQYLIKFKKFSANLLLTRLMNAIGMSIELTKNDYQIISNGYESSRMWMIRFLSDGAGLKGLVGRTFNSYNVGVSIFYYAVNSMHKELIELLASKFVTPVNEISEALDLALENMRDNMSSFENLEEIFSKISRMNSYQRQIFDCLPIENKLNVYLDPYSKCTISAQDFKILPIESVIELYYNDRISEYEEHSFLQCLNAIDAEEREKIDKKTLASILLKSSNRYLSKQEVKVIVEIAKKLPDFKFLLDAINYRTRYEKYINNTVKGISKEATSDLPKGLTEFFDFEYSIYEKGNEAIIKLLIISSWEDCVFEATVKDDTFSVDNNEIISESNLTKFEEICKSIYGYFIKNFGEEINSKLSEINKQIEVRKKIESLRKLEQSIKNLNSLVEKTDIMLDEKQKAGVEVSINRINSIKYELSLKIGLSKKYVVKNICSFLRYFADCERVKYGKSFEFTHRISNLDSVSGELISFLMCITGEGNSYSSTRGISLNCQAMSKVLKILKNQTIEFNKVTYRVSLNKEKCSVYIDKKYTMHTNIGDDECELIKMGDDLFVINKTKKVIDYVDGADDVKDFYVFAKMNDGVTIEPALERFRDTVYSQFYSEIDISDKISDKLIVSEVEISAYFDYNNKVISVRTEMKKGGKTCTERDLSTILDKNKFLRYKAYIERIGFEDGVMKDDSNVLNFFSMDMAPLKKHCKVYLSDAIQSKKLQPFGKPIIRIQYNNNIMSAFLEESNFTDEELEKIIKAIRMKRSYILLRGEKIVDLTSQDVHDFANAVKDIGMNESRLSQSVAISTSQALKAFAHEENCKIDEYLQTMVNEISDFKNADIEIPNVNAELRDYQKEAYKWMKIIDKYHVGAILADDMGLGKTLEMITLLKSDDTAMPNLVVCPKSLVFNWINEFMRFDPEAKIRQIYGVSSLRSQIINEIDHNEKVTYITSYDSLRNDIEYYEGIAFNHLVLDEAQYIKNVNAQKSKSVKSINAAHRFALTGTPIENNVIDLWSIFDFIMPGYFEELNEFKSYYNRDEEFTSVIAKRIAPFILRRTKRDVLTDLPEKYERILSVDMTKEQRSVYDAYRLEAKKNLMSGAAAFDMLPYLTRLRQVCDDPAMFIDDYNAGSGKIEMLKELISEYIANEHRILIFSSFVKGLNRVENLLNSEKIPYYIITGDVSSEKRIQLMNDFNAGEDVNVFLISLKAGGTGLNLVGADTVIHLDPWWNVAAENQASDRAHRIGQTRNVEVIKLVCENSIEQRVIELQNIKKDVIDKLISNDDSSVTGATLDDISFILD